MSMLQFIRMLAWTRDKIDCIKDKEDKEYIIQWCKKLDSDQTFMLSEEDQTRLLRIHTEIT